MKNKYKLPSDVYKTVCQYVAGYERRKERLSCIDKNNMSRLDIADFEKNTAVDNATKKIGVHIQSEELRTKLQTAIKMNCCDKNLPYKYFDLPGISSYCFFKEKHNFLYNIARNCNLIN